jgi:hypothetical protein
MAIFRDKAPLVEAATGKKPAAAPMPTETPMGKALLQKVSPVASYEDYATAQGFPTGVPVTNLGLSPEGKYGGYYNKEDLETAIAGEAQARNVSGLDYAQTLRDLAAKRQSQIGQTIASQLAPSRVEAFYSGEAANDPRMAALSEFRQRGLSEASDLTATAQQIERTPMSQYARAIATNRYGINPALAAGMFGPEYEMAQAKLMRDQAFFDPQAGVLGYEDFLKQEDRDYTEGQRAQAEIKDFVDEAVRTRNPQMLLKASEYSQAAKDLYYTDALTQQFGGINATPIIKAAGITPQVAEGATRDDKGVKLKLADGQDLFSSELAEVENLVAGDPEGTEAFQFVDSMLYSDDEKEQLRGRLLAAYVDQLLFLSGKVGRRLTQRADLQTILGE